MTAQPASSYSAEQISGNHPVSIDPHESGRRFGIRDGLFQAVAQGGGEQYLPAFALLLHATPFQLSLLSAIPQLLGTWAQLISVELSHWFPNRVSQVFWGVVGQSVSWIPILALPLLWPDQYDGCSSQPSRCISPSLISPLLPGIVSSLTYSLPTNEACTSLNERGPLR